MSTSDERKTAMLDRVVDYLLAEGLSAASLRPLARAAGTSDRMLLYYFTDKAELIEAALEHGAARLTGVLTERAAPEPLPLDELRPHLADMLMDDELWPFMRLWLDIANQAARGDPVCARVGERIGRGFHAWAAAQLKSDEPEIDAARLLVQIEGMVLLKSLGLGDIAEKAR